MTEQEICDKQRENGNAEMYLLRKGNFWRAYDGGAFAVARITGYQVRCMKTVNRHYVGFPAVAAARVLDTLRQHGVEILQEDDGLVIFRGGDPTPDENMVNSTAGNNHAAKDVRQAASAIGSLLAGCRHIVIDIRLLDD